MATEIAGENPDSPVPSVTGPPGRGLNVMKIANPRRARRIWKGPIRPHALAPAAEPGSTDGSEIATLEQRRSTESRPGQHSETRAVSDRSEPIYLPGSSSAQPSDRPINEVDFAELEDGTLIELVESPASPGRRCLAVCKDGQIRFLERVEHNGQVFVPLTQNSGSLGRIRLARSAEPYQSVQKLLSRVESLISQCIAVDEKYVTLLADFVLSTWFIDRFSVAPYLSVIGLPQSGKTTLLKVLSLVCRRPLLIADITSASFYRACSRFMPTILIDETGTAGNNRTLRHILRSGTTRDVLAVRNNCSLHSYGAKVVSWLEPPDDSALNSRCILIPMFESKSTSLARTDDPRVQQLAMHLQAQLLSFRLENFKKVQPASVPGDEALRPRTRDLLWALTAAHAQDAKRSQRVLQFFASGQGLPSEPLSPEQNAVLRMLFLIVHLRESFFCIHISELTESVNRFLGEMGENLRLQPRKIGAVLTSLGFSNRTRTNSGWVLSLTRQDAEKLHQLVASYGMDGFRERMLSVAPDDCSLCRAAGVRSKKAESEIPGGTMEEVDLLRTMRSQEGRPHSRH